MRIEYASSLLIVPWSVVEDGKPKMVGSKTASSPCHESYGDCDAAARVIAGTGADADGSIASHAHDTGGSTERPEARARGAGAGS